MTDSGAITYVGDRYRRFDGSINKVDTTWATGTSPNWAATKAAANAIELLGYNVSGSNVRGGTGTTNVTTSPTTANFRDLVWGQNGYDLNIVQYRTDKAGIVHCTIGRASFQPEQLKTNLVALIEALNKAKPAGVKGVYLKKVSLSSTMGAGVRVDNAAFGTAPAAQ